MIDMNDLGMQELIQRLLAENGRLRDCLKEIGERMEKVSDDHGACKIVVDRWISEMREALAEGKE